MSKLSSVIRVLTLALIAPYIYDRYIALAPIVANRSGSLDNLQDFQIHEVKFKDQLRNCEDVILEENLGVAFLSCDPGRDRWNTVMGTFKPEKDSEDHGGIWVYDYASPDMAEADRLKRLDIEEKDIHPLGIDFDATTSTLYVVNHSRHKGSHILIVHIDVSTLAATVVARFKHPLIHAPNSIQVLGDHKLYITNDHYMLAATSPLLSKVETFSGVPGGTVVYVDTRFPQTAKVVARVPFANGIALINKTTLAVASSSKSGIYLFERVEGNALELSKVVRVPAAVDNLSVDSNGKLLLAGHSFAPALMKVSTGRSKCNDKGSEDEKQACACTAPSWVAQWDEEEGLQPIYKDDGSEFCSSSTAVRDIGREVGIVSGLYERGILVFKE
ncbi:hypothetical protein N0V94_000365 [Neodidymelliopsis sp. IMI 364377]|nr:hypothetical protein N0V94_000365 [Neodidymelliopsis sp. IMI 364377]